MPKAKRKSNKRSKNKLNFSEAEEVLIGLDTVVKSGSEDAVTANSLRIWWLRNQSWTLKQWAFARSIIAKHGAKKAKAKAKKSKKYHLYAISDGTAIKLGYSGNIGSRIKAMQTGHPQELTCVWKFYTGRGEPDARTLEKKLHRFCSKYALRGEWFSLDCMTIVEQFKIKESISRDYQTEQQYKNKTI